MKTKTGSIRLVLFLAGLTLFTGCKKDPETISLPMLTVTRATEVTITSAMVSGNVFDQGNSEITARGFCWSTTPESLITDDQMTEGKGLGQFTGRITGLLPGTDYHVRAWATNFEGTSYGAPVMISTPLTVTQATLATLAPEYISLTSVVSGGEITDIGGGEITEKGICWSTEPAPTVSNSKATVEISGLGSGRFTIKLSNLESGQKYYLRSYAINSAGVAYGTEFSFRTLTFIGVRSSEYPGSPHPTATFSIGNKVYLGFGDLGWGTTDVDLWEWDRDANKWTRLADYPGTEGMPSLAFAVGGKGYVLQNFWYSEDGSTNEFWEYDPGTNRWTRKSNLPANGFRLSPVAFSIGTKGFIGLGEVYELPYDTEQRRRDFWEWDQTTDVWTRKADFPGPGRSGAASFTIGNKGFIATGATEEGMIADFWEYDWQSDQWTRKADFVGAARSGAIGFSSGNKGYLGAGFNSASPGEYEQDLWEWDQTLNSWAQIGYFADSGFVASGGNSGDGGYYISGSGYPPSIYTFSLTSEK